MPAPHPGAPPGPLLGELPDAPGPRLQPGEAGARPPRGAGGGAAPPTPAGSGSGARGSRCRPGGRPPRRAPAPRPPPPRPRPHVPGAHPPRSLPPGHSTSGPLLPEERKQRPSQRRRSDRAEAEGPESSKGLQTSPSSVRLGRKRRRPRGPAEVQASGLLRFPSRTHPEGPASRCGTSSSSRGIGADPRPAPSQTEDRVRARFSGRGGRGGTHSAAPWLHRRETPS